MENNKELDLNDITKKINTKVSLVVPGQPVWENLFVVGIRFSEKSIWYTLLYMIDEERGIYMTMDEISDKYVRTAKKKEEEKIDLL